MTDRPAASTVTDAQLDELHDALDGAYRERAHLVAHLAALYPAHIGYTDPNAIDWLVVTIETPAGQMSWHIAERDRDLFEHVRLVPSTHNVWDGHTTEQKYARLRRLTAQARSAEAFIAFVADTIADHEGDEWANHSATTAIRTAITRHATGQQPGPEETDTAPADPDARASYAQAVARVESSGPQPAEADQPGLPPWLLAGVRDQSIPGQGPAEHCGHLSPQTLLTTPPTECVLRPGHTGSHADDRGARWWPTPDNRARQILCGHFIIDSGHRRECTELLGHTGAHTDRHGPAWTVPEEPAPAATEATHTPNTITDPAWLREQYAAAIRAVWEGWITDWASVDIPDPEGVLADAVLRVRDRHVQQLRQRLQLAAELAGTIQAAKQRYAAEQDKPADGEVSVLEQLGYHAMGQALDLERVERQRDQLAAAIDQVRRFNEMVAHASCRVQAAEHARDTLQILDAALNPKGQS